MVDYREILKRFAKATQSQLISQDFPSRFSGNRPRMQPPRQRLGLDRRQMRDTMIDSTGNL